MSLLVSLEEHFGDTSLTRIHEFNKDGGNEFNLHSLLPSCQKVSGSLEPIIIDVGKLESIEESISKRIYRFLKKLLLASKHNPDFRRDRHRIL